MPFQRGVPRPRNFRGRGAPRFVFGWPGCFQKGARQSAQAQAPPPAQGGHSTNERGPGGVKKVNRYEFDGEAIEVPVCCDRHLRRYVEDCTAYCEQPGYTPAGRPVLLTFEDACPPGRDGGRRPARHRLRRLPTLPSISRLPAGRMQKRKAQKEKAARPQGRPNPKKQGGNMMRKQGERLPGGKKSPL